MLKRYVRNFSTNVYLNAAKELGIKFTILDKERSFCHLYFGKNSIPLINSALGVNNIASSKTSDNKDMSADILRQITSIGPKYSIFHLDKDSPRNITRRIYALTRQNDIVIKAPSSYGGKGIYVRPQTQRQIQYAVKELYLHHQVTKILVEPFFVATEEYRIHSYCGHIIDIFLRKPAFVVGDGQQTIEQLIQQKNDRREARL